MVKKVFSFVFMLFIPLGVGFVASKLAPESGQIYSTLTLPPLAPPGYVFGIVWTVIYVLMGISAYLVTQENVHSVQKRKALVLYFLQLTINFFWTFFFFTIGLRLFALLWLVLLLSVLAYCMQVFRKISRSAFLLLLPYFIWGLFAAYLNLGIYILNS